MIDIKTELGAQSYCFRHFKDNATVIEKLKECGLNRIELCGVHADFTVESGFDALIKQYSDAGVTITSIGVQGFKNDEANERKFFEFARRAGYKVISADFAVDAMPQCLDGAQKLADEYDINLAIHNHGGHHWLGSGQMLRHILKNTSERIGLCLDTAWALQAGEDPLKFAAEFGSKLYGLHIKDFVFDRAGKGEDVVVGTGNLDLPKLFEILKTQNYSGYAVLEYEGDVENPVPALQKCVEAVRQVS
jgi:sugar phosphate isomerase/epimerase